ncbi:MAG TPA: MFS transporter [Gammaproteobacteria bacterium]|nr:MFS transporter [Gammaproteobacteria bacterium]
MTPTETRAATSLASIFSLRMLGLFMIYPVFSVYAMKHLAGATPTTIGIALGGYGLTQAIFQIPFGSLSDRFGRKPLITLGLLIFAGGSALAGASHTIVGVIIGRVLQGAGAVGSTILALAADLTREEHRTKAMAMIGMTIGFSFALAVVLGPVLNTWIGVSGIFWLTAVLALLGIGVLQLVVPRPVRSRFHRDTEAVPALFKSVLTDGQLLRLDFGIMALHLMLTASFVALPIAITHAAGLKPAHQWYLYLPVLLVSVFAMVPFIILAEKRRKMKQVFLGAILALGIAELILMEWHNSLVGVGVALTVFFTAFTLMEASLPSLISKVAPPASKGTAMGVYSSSQFFGIFIGGTVGGWMMGHHGLYGVFAFTAIVAGIWFLIAWTMKSPRYLNSYLLNVGPINERDAAHLATRLTQVQGVAEAAVVPEDGVAYLKVDGHALDEAALRALVPVREGATV